MICITPIGRRQREASNGQNHAPAWTGRAATPLLQEIGFRARIFHRATPILPAPRRRRGERPRLKRRNSGRNLARRNRQSFSPSALARPRQRRRRARLDAHRARDAPALTRRLVAGLVARRPVGWSTSDRGALLLVPSALHAAGSVLAGRRLLCASAVEGRIVVGRALRGKRAAKPCEAGWVGDSGDFGGTSNTEVVDAPVGCVVGVVV